MERCRATARQCAQTPRCSDPAVARLQYCEALAGGFASGLYVFHRSTSRCNGRLAIQDLPRRKGLVSPDERAFPGFAAEFDRRAPKRLRASRRRCHCVRAGRSSPGIFACSSRSAELEHFLSGPPANLPRNLAFDLDEGIVESDRWFGPLFTNLRLIKTDVPITFSTGDRPLVQVQPLQRGTYADEVYEPLGLVRSMGDFPAEAWSRYEESIVKPNLQPARAVGGYAAEVRRRKRGGCPVHHIG